VEAVPAEVEVEIVEEVVEEIVEARGDDWTLTVSAFETRCPLAHC
jgi:hypothetical protein